SDAGRRCGAGIDAGPGRLDCAVPVALAGAIDVVTGDDDLDVLAWELVLAPLEGLTPELLVEAVKLPCVVVLVVPVRPVRGAPGVVGLSPVAPMAVVVPPVVLHDHVRRPGSRPCAAQKHGAGQRNRHQDPEQPQFRVPHESAPFARWTPSPLS